MRELKRLYMDILSNGSKRDTRTGSTIGLWDYKLRFDLNEGFPATTAKKLAWKTCVGELLWFLSGSDWLGDLKHYTFGDKDADKWTIWTDDAERWSKKRQGGGENDAERWGRENWVHPTEVSNYVGDLYGVQWRGGQGFESPNVDQIQNLINGLIDAPHERNHIVMAWNPGAIADNRMALKPCHLGFQCYVDNSKKLHLKFWIRSSDTFLGLPFNIASYALLTHLLAKWTGLGVGTLTADLGDVHIYENHLDAVGTYLQKPTHTSPSLALPTGCDKLESTLQLTALDFADSLHEYWHEGTIKAPLSVGK